MRQQLMRNLSKPSKVASILDWKKAFNHTVLAVNFHKNRVGIAVASHPSLGIPCLELEPLRFEDSGGNRKNIAGAIDRKCLERFSDIIEEYKVRIIRITQSYAGIERNRTTLQLHHGSYISRVSFSF